MDREPIHPVAQGPQAGKKRSKQSSESPKRNTARHSKANSENLEMRPPPHYDNRLSTDFDQI